jgi:hypothetical protein
MASGAVMLFGTVTCAWPGGLVGLALLLLALGFSLVVVGKHGKQYELSCPVLSTQFLLACGNLLWWGFFLPNRLPSTHWQK